MGEEHKNNKCGRYQIHATFTYSEFLCSETNAQINVKKMQDSTDYIQCALSFGENIFFLLMKLERWKGVW